MCVALRVIVSVVFSIAIQVIYCLERPVPQVTCYITVSRRTLNSNHCILQS